MANEKHTNEEAIKILKEAIDFINHQKTENAYLKDYIEDLIAEIRKLNGSTSSTIISNVMESQRIKKEIKTEAYREFAKMAVVRLTNNYRSEYTHWIDDTVYALLKEMIAE